MGGAGIPLDIYRRADQGSGDPGLCEVPPTWADAWLQKAALPWEIEAPHPPAGAELSSSPNAWGRRWGGISLGSRGKAHQGLVYSGPGRGAPPGMGFPLWGQTPSCGG